MARAKDTTVRIGDRDVTLPASDCEQVRKLLKQGRKIDAIAIIRRRANIDLRSVKQAVDGESIETRAAKPVVKRHLSMRERLMKYPAAIAAVAVSMILMSMGVGVSTVRGAGPHGGLDMTWYYDLGTERLFAAPFQPAPITAPSDSDSPRRSGVIAHVFTCGQCNDDEWFVSYLEKYSDDAQYAVTALREGADTQEEARLVLMAAYGHMVRIPNHDAWLLFDSAKGMEVRRRADERCGGDARPCYPD